MRRVVSIAIMAVMVMAYPFRIGEAETLATNPNDAITHTLFGFGEDAPRSTVKFWSARDLGVLEVEVRVPPENASWGTLPEPWLRDHIAISLAPDKQASPAQVIRVISVPTGIGFYRDRPELTGGYIPIGIESGTVGYSYDGVFRIEISIVKALLKAFGPGDRVAVDLAYVSHKGFATLTGATPANRDPSSFLTLVKPGPGQTASQQKGYAGGIQYRPLQDVGPELSITSGIITLLSPQGLEGVLQDPFGYTGASFTLTGAPEKPLSENDRVLFMCSRTVGKHLVVQEVISSLKGKGPGPIAMKLLTALTPEARNLYVSLTGHIDYDKGLFRDASYSPGIKLEGLENVKESSGLKVVKGVITLGDNAEPILNVKEVEDVE